jgi:hypothetical protein
MHAIGVPDENVWNRGSAGGVVKSPAPSREDIAPCTGFAGKRPGAGNSRIRLIGIILNISQGHYAQINLIVKPDQQITINSF